MVGAIGAIVLAFSHAATPASSIEAEDGTVSPAELIISDITASGDKAIRFANRSGSVSSSTPCIGKTAPAKWNHVIVLMFENKRFTNVINNEAYPHISSLANKCGTYADWKDADTRANGTKDGSYPSKPNYGTLTSGLPPSVSKLTTNSYSASSDVDNIFNRLNSIGKSAKSYSSGSPLGCSQSNFVGAYHDPMRFYTNLGGKSSDVTTYCNTHQANINTLITDANSGKLPAYSFVLPTNDENTHNNTAASGDDWAIALLNPLLDSAQYKTGDTAIFFLWDEDTPIPNVLIAPSIIPGSRPTLAPGSNPITHFSALRTWQEMLGITPLLGETGEAPSLLNYYNGQP